MLRFIDTENDWDAAMNGPCIEYVKKLYNGCLFS